MDFTLLYAIAFVHCLVQLTQCNYIGTNIGIVDLIAITLIMEVYVVLWCFQLF